MKKLSILILTFLMILSCMTGCLSPSTADQEAKQTTDSKSNTPIVSTKETTKSEPQKETTKSTETTKPLVTSRPTIEQNVIFEQNGLKITAKSLEYDRIWGYQLKLLFENNSDAEVSISLETVLVNGHLESELLISDILPGKKLNEKISFSNSDLEKNGIEKLAQIELFFEVETDDQTYQTGGLCINTSAYGNIEILEKDQGFEMINQDGVRIVAKYWRIESSFSRIVFYIENNSDKDITIISNDLSINGYMITGSLYLDVKAGGIDIDEIVLFTSSLEENGIENIEEFELSFKVRDEESFDLVFESDIIKVVS